jgi:PAS domain S-box-containing protein
MTTIKTAGVASRRAWQLLFGTITMAFGLLTLMGWLLEVPLLASLVAGRMPMPPSTALLFLLLGFATCLCARTPLSRRAFQISVALGWLVALVALPLFTLNVLNMHPVIEHFGLSAAGTVGGMTIGHMSPVTAFCFLLTSLSFLASLSHAALRRWRVGLAFGATGVLLGLCFVFLLAYGCDTPLLYGGTFLPPALGTILAFITQGLALLVLEQAQLTEVRREVEQRHRSILQTAMDGFWRVDMQGRLLEVNDAYCRMSGYSEQELLAMRIPDVEVVEAAADTIAHLQKVMAQGEDRFESRQRRKDGSCFDVEVSIQYRRVNGGGCVVFLRDITEHKVAEKELRESERKYHYLVDTLREGIWLIDKDAITTFVNPKMAEMLGYGVGDMIGKSLFHFMDERGVAIAGRNVERRKPGIIEEHEFEFIRKDENRIYTLLATTPIMDENGNYGGALAGVTDITERKRLENEILQIADWEKTRIGRDLHDTLGQQLAGLAYLSQMLAQNWRTQSEADTDKHTAQVVMETRRAVELVREVARGLTPVAPGRNGLVEALRGMAERTQAIHGVTCVLQPTDAEVTVSDPQAATHLNLIAQEAVTNALRHGRARHIVIGLAVDENQGELRIQNNGVDMPVDRPDGSGMGLRIMQYRADLIGGTLAIERAEGGGTRVVCRFAGGGGGGREGTDYRAAHLPPSTFHQPDT